MDRKLFMKSIKNRVPAYQFIKICDSVRRDYTVLVNNSFEIIGSSAFNKLWNYIEEIFPELTTFIKMHRHWFKGWDAQDQKRILDEYIKDMNKESSKELKLILTFLQRFKKKYESSFDEFASEMDKGQYEWFYKAAERIQIKLIVLGIHKAIVTEIIAKGSDSFKFENRYPTHGYKLDKVLETRVQEYEGHPHKYIITNVLNPDDTFSEKLVTPVGSSDVLDMELEFMAHFIAVECRIRVISYCFSIFE